MEIGDREGEDIENWMAASGAGLGNTGTNTYRSNRGNDAESALDLAFSTGIGRGRILYYSRTIDQSRSK